MRKRRDADPRLGDDGELMTRSATSQLTYRLFFGLALLAVATPACSDSAEDDGTGAGSNATGGASGGDTGGGDTGGAATGGTGGALDCGTPIQCAEIWEENSAQVFDELVDGDPDALREFLSAVPKGGDLHNHLSGSIYAETYLTWAEEGGNCINPVDFKAVYPNQCSASNQPAPTSGAFFDDIVRAWSMKDFVPGVETGRDHFFSTFGKFGVIAGGHRYDSLADVALRAHSENQLYIETMFNVGRNIADLTVDIWAGSLQVADIPGLYDDTLADPTFASELAADIAYVETTADSYRQTLGCSSANPPPACEVDIRFVAQVSRTGGKDRVFGTLISAFETAAHTDMLVAANLSSPEDNTTSINNYMLHMEMLDFLHQKYTVTNASPLHITLHAGELTEDFIPAGSDANTFHIRQAVELGHAERIGHGVDILSETDPTGLMADMAQSGVLVEVCLSSNDQILEVSGTDHPLDTYIQNGVPVALATDDQGVSRSSLAGEYFLAATDQNLSYRQLKTMARDSLQHAFLPGDALWTSVADAEVVADCAPTDTMGLGQAADAACQALLDGSEKARMQWALEGRFRAFESLQVP